jgi:hypothetical protein
MKLRPCLAVAAAAAALAAPGCGGQAPAPETPETPEKPERAERTPPKQPPRPPRVKPVRCPPGAPAGCESARGRVLYVEAVDADGDGDAHFVLASPEGISGPGISAVDVRRDLRPHPLPRVGDAVAAAGPVYRGSFGQRQIEAIDLRVARARRPGP